MGGLGAGALTLGVSNVGPMSRVMHAGHALLSLYRSIFEALRTCVVMDMDAPLMWATAKDLCGLLHDVMAPLQASPEIVVSNLEEYASLLCKLTAISPQPVPVSRNNMEMKGSGESSSKPAHVPAYVVTHLTSKVLGSMRGDSAGECFRRGTAGEWAKTAEIWRREAEEEARYEASLVEFHVLVLQLFRSMIYWVLGFEAGNDLDVAHPLSLHSLPALSQALSRLWTRPLPSLLKTEIVLVLNSLLDVENAPNTNDSQTLSMATRGGVGTPNHSSFLASILDYFVTLCLLPPIRVCGPRQEGVDVSLGNAVAGWEGVGEQAPQAPSALMYELSLFDRTRGQFQHTLAILTLLTTLSRASASPPSLVSALFSPIISNK